MVGPGSNKFEVTGEHLGCLQQIHVFSVMHPNGYKDAKMILVYLGLGDFFFERLLNSRFPMSYGEPVAHVQKGVSALVQRRLCRG